MPKLGDSRTMEGPGLIPAQDHRPDIDLEKRACQIAVRIVDQTEDFVRYHVDDEELRGYVHGLSVWGLDDSGSTSPQPCVMWRHAWPSMVEPFGDAYLEEPPPADAFPSFPSTPGGGSAGSLDRGGWSPGGGGNVVIDPRQRIGGSDSSNTGGPNAPGGWRRL
jgi:hypothetical protein